jgi:hypothetical protein
VFAESQLFFARTMFYPAESRFSDAFEISFAIGEAKQARKVLRSKPSKNQFTV